jgi:hypothetical protein
MTDSAVGEPVAVMRSGILRGCAQTGGETWVAGNNLWGKAGGGISNVRQTAPTPQVLVGQVAYSEGSSLFTVVVNVQVLPSLGELSGVSQETPADKDVFIHKLSTGVWEPRKLNLPDIYGPTTTKTTSYTATAEDYTIRCNAVGASMTVNLPAAASSTGLIYNIKKVDSSANFVRIDGNASELVEDATTQDLLRQGENLMIHCNGTSWDVL